MIYILHGSINSGKTTRMFELFGNSPAGTADGFISAKIYKEKEFIGYELVRLSNQQKAALALLFNEYHNDFTEPFRYERFIFAGEAFRWGDSIIKELSTAESQKDIYIDEIGPIELQGQGFAKSLSLAIAKPNNLYITVRTSCVNQFITKFNVTRYILLK